MTRAELRRRRREVERTLRTLRGEMDLQLGELLQELAALDAAETARRTRMLDTRSILALLAVVACSGVPPTSIAPEPVPDATADGNVPTDAGDAADTAPDEHTGTSCGSYACAGFGDGYYITVGAQWQADQGAEQVCDDAAGRPCDPGSACFIYREASGVLVIEQSTCGRR